MNVLTPATSMSLAPTREDTIEDGKARFFRWDERADLRHKGDQRSLS